MVVANVDRRDRSTGAELESRQRVAHVLLCSAAIAVVAQAELPVRILAPALDHPAGAEGAPEGSTNRDMRRHVEGLTEIGRGRGGERDRLILVVPDPELPVLVVARAPKRSARDHAGVGANELESC